MSQSIVELKHVNIYQSNSLILSDVNISVDKGEFVYLVGKTGTGKSSLLKTLYGDLELTEGEGWVVGRNLKELTWKTVPFLRRNLGVVFQDFQLLTDRNVNENMKFVLPTLSQFRRGPTQAAPRHRTRDPRDGRRIRRSHATLGDRLATQIF